MRVFLNHVLMKKRFKYSTEYQPPGGEPAGAQRARIPRAGYEIATTATEVSMERPWYTPDPADPPPLEGELSSLGWKGKFAHDVRQ